MSKHWRPEGNVVPFRRRKRARRIDWTRPGAYGYAPHRPGAKMRFGALLLLVAAVGGYAGFTIDPGQWTAPETKQAAPTPMAEQADFGLCEWGGATNCVVDGDTFYWRGDKIRIAGIDAPETHDLYQCDAELALGRKATARLHEMLNSGAVSLSSIDRDEDVYGRKLRNVAVDGRDVGEVLIGEGLAREYGSGRRGWC